MIFIVDEIMGSGKTKKAIEYINSTKREQKFIFVTPYLSEVERIVELCPAKNFYAPDNKKGNKNKSLMSQIKERRNIVTTHALFGRLSKENLDEIKKVGYELIMDETSNVIEEYETIGEGDYEGFIKNKTTIDDNGCLTWTGSFSKKYYKTEYELCKLHSLYYKNGKFYKLQSPYIYSSFKNVYIMTYRFKSQLHSYYLNMHGLKYRYRPFNHNTKSPHDFAKLIIIDKHEQLYKWDNRSILDKNKNDETIFSKNWYRTRNAEQLKEVRNALTNYFRNLPVHYDPVFGYERSKKEYNMWTTFKQYRNQIGNNGYQTCFVPCNAKATNEFMDKTVIAYLCNIYVPPAIKEFFPTVNEDEYALTEMLQFLWRSAIRLDKTITVYIPSKRMRNLLKKWLSM